MKLLFFDDGVAREFEPFALTRPTSELRAGAELVRRRWELALGAQTAAIIAAPHLADFEEPGVPPILREEIPAGSVVINSRCAVSLARAHRDADVWRCGGRVAGVRTRERLLPARVAELSSLDDLVTSTARAVEVQGLWMDAIWDYVRHLPSMLSSDIPLIGAAIDLAAPGSLTRLGSHPVYIEQGADIESFVVFDVTAGPVLVRRGASVMAFTRLVGPCVIGEQTVVNGGRIAASSIGEVCRVHGELSTTIFLGYANKSHDGFLGHSMLGRWVNLGASTVNSNLKNTYGSVSLWTPGGTRETGMQFLGTFCGDHVKTAIGTRFTTGCVIGAGANIFGNRTTPKVVPPFSWGLDGEGEVALERFLVTAERAMSRRDVAFGERARRQLAAAYNRRWRVKA